MWFLPLLAGNESPDTIVPLDPCVLQFIGGGLTITQGGLTPVTVTLAPCVLTVVGGDLTITTGEPPASGGGVTSRPAVTLRPAVTACPPVTVRPTVG